MARLNTRAQKPTCNYFRRSRLPTLLICKMAPSLSPMAQQEASRLSHTIQRAVNGQHLAPSRKPIRLSTNMRIMQPSSPCGGKASRNALLFHSPSPHSILSRPRSCPTLNLTPCLLVALPRLSHCHPHSLFFSLTSHTLIIHSRGVFFLPAGKCSSVVVFRT